MIWLCQYRTLAQSYWIYWHQAMIPWKVWLLVANVTPRFCLQSRHHLGKKPNLQKYILFMSRSFLRDLEMPLQANSFSWPSGARVWDGHRGRHSALLAGIILTLNLAKTCLPDNYNKHCKVNISCSNINSIRYPKTFHSSI